MRDDKIGAKIRNAQLEKVPYMLVTGAKEAEARSVAVRSREKGDEGRFLLTSSSREQKPKRASTISQLGPFMK